MEDSEVHRDHSYQTGRKADFGNSSFHGITLTVTGIYIYFICCFCSFIFSFPFLLRGSIEKKEPYFDQNSVETNVIEKYRLFLIVPFCAPCSC